MSNQLETCETCTCTGQPQTSLDPAAFDPARLCITHFDKAAAAASIRGIGRRRFRAADLTVEHAVAIALAFQGTRDRTAEAYETQARRFISFHGGRFLTDITPHDLEVDLASIRADVQGRAAGEARCGNGDGATDSYLMFVRALFKKVEAFLPPGSGNPAASVQKRQRQTAGRREHYSQMQLAMIFRSVVGHLEGSLYLLMLYLIRTTGIRRSSLVGLNLEDIDFTTGETVIRGKGGFVYTVYISDVLRRDLLILHQRHRGLSDSQMAAQIRNAVNARSRGDNAKTAHKDGAYDVRTGKNGTPALWTRRGNPITRRTGERLIAAVRQGLPPGVVIQFDLHALRHTFIGQVRDNFGEDAAAGLAGHRNKRTASSEAQGTYTLIRGPKHRAILRWLFGPVHQFGVVPDDQS